ncbi:DUF4871 domain-containing protein [Paenibacillus radicis (ex Gao et al. 2016)]|uniref:DUF4871 domain-containing protein n=1 Tax=Paenibacillus radicis (ex Gao et al. 2016) TaxID=1737354 RepID=A0A917GTA1_9BACL|nr:DUF4871 domain-containing protein [Paenibacillus radicis (ex Gao et al. 2016)]GGG55935.1 hypothetical protein GCM10010918_06060 [Paenibacillus radicis (ex Gao et al. 2016)]
MKDDNQSGIPDWTRRMKESPFRQEPFSENMKEKIRSEVRRGTARRTRANRLRWRVGGIAAAVALLVFAAWQALPDNVSHLLIATSKPIQLEERTAYTREGRELLEMMPGGDFEAGTPQGLIISFKEPFKVYEGKTISIKAVHADSGIEETIVAGDKITEPSSGYETLSRYAIAGAGVPLSGYWRFIVELDGVFYGDAILEAAEPAWEESQVFVSEPYSVRGTPGRLGVMNQPFIAGKANKYMWWLWGEESELQGEFKAVAAKEGGTGLIELFSLSVTGAKSNYADRYFPSTLMLPEAGRWRIMAYVDGKLLGSIAVTAEEPKE